MTRKLPENLTPEQMIALYDALLSNADSLLVAADTLLGEGKVALARSLAILGLEEAGKAIAIFDRRVAIATAPEGESFINDELRNLWANHHKKLMLVHTFLVEEKYWFGVEEPIHELQLEPDVDTYFATLEQWARDDNILKQNGFYVGVDPSGDVISPQIDPPSAEDVADVLGYVHQIGWQLRLGEHIEAKAQAEKEKGQAPATDDELRETLAVLSKAGVSGETVDRVLEYRRHGVPGVPLHNDQWRLRLPATPNPFENLDKPGYEAERRELLRFADPDTPL